MTHSQMKAHKISRLVARSDQMKMLVTGTHGFIGAAFCRIAAKKITVIPVSRNTQRRLPRADILVHLGARTAKSKNEASTPGMYMRDNVLGTKKLLRRLSHKPSYILYVSTMDVVASKLTAYAKSKREAEKVVSEYCTKYRIPFGIARLGSVYGPGEGEYGKVIPTFITQALAGEKHRIVDPKVTRRFIYVDDVAKALMGCIQTKTEGIIPIIGTKDISIGDLSKRITTLIHATPKHPDSFDRNLASEIHWFQKRRVIYFDVDGTIINHWDRSYASYKASAGNQAVLMKEYKMKKREGCVFPVDTTLIESEKLLQKDTLVPGIKQVLGRLHASHRLVALSARQSKEKLEKQLMDLGIKKYFQSVSIGKDMGDGMAIGDSEADIEAAKRAGIRCISVSWGVRSGYFLKKHGASEIVHTPRALLRKILNSQ